MLHNKTVYIIGFLFITIVRTVMYQISNLFINLCFVYVCSKKKLCAIYGKWTECLYTVDPATFDAHKKSDKKNSDEKKGNKPVFIFLLLSKSPVFCLHLAQVKLKLICVYLCGPRVTMRSQKRCLHLMLRRSRSSQAASSSGR